VLSTLRTSRGVDLRTANFVLAMGVLLALLLQEGGLREAYSQSECFVFEHLAYTGRSGSKCDRPCLGCDPLCMHLNGKPMRPLAVFLEARSMLCF
jgi:hypothetical protein